MHVAVIWCIHGYPALSTLSGRVTGGYYACVHCDKNPCSRKIRGKIFCYIGHRRWLEIYDAWRKIRDFDEQIEKRDKPQKFSAKELMEQLERVNDVRPGKHPQSKKRKRDADDCQCWKRRSCLCDIPYWGSLKLRHNLYAMHIEKNICDYIISTFLGIVGKTKDTITARLDLEDMGIRKHLHLKRDGDSYSVPKASYIAFRRFLRSVKFPDGYASNLATCISADGCNLQGLKTHDCHILLQRILPIAIRGIMHKDIYEAIVELGLFFQQLCAKTLKLDVLHRMKKEISIILCKLEKIFPPAFFYVMLHLTVHLPDEAILRGPVQYGWMYPVERRLLTLKRYVRNMARPEGSIAEAYVANECLTACSRYFDDLDTRHNREDKNKERVDAQKGDLSVFQHGVVLLGAYNIIYLENDYDKMIWYVLNNCEEVEPCIELQKKKKRFGDGEEVDDGLYALVCQPDLRVKLFSACLVGGVRFHTIDREENRRTQNSRVMTEGTHNGNYIDFYGCLKDIIMLQYNSDSRTNRTFDNDDGKKQSRMKDDGYMRSINQASCWFKDDPFIFATQATKSTEEAGGLFKSLYIGTCSVWQSKKLTYNSHTKMTSVSFEVRSNKGNLDNAQDSSGDNPVTIDASVVDELRRQRDLEQEVNGYESSDSEDETRWMRLLSSSLDASLALDPDPSLDTSLDLDPALDSAPFRGEDGSWTRDAKALNDVLGLDTGSRAESIVRNNHILRSFGVGAAKAMLNKITPMSKVPDCEESDPLYQPRDDESHSKEISDQDTHHGHTKRSAKGSKRVMLTEPPARITRQRTRELSPTEENALLPVPNEPSSKNEKRKRVLRVGRDLDRISRGLNSKIPVILLEGKKRPEAPMQAAKLAEAGIILRNHIPILPHWKLYKKEKAMRQDYREKVAGPFSMDITKKEVKVACKDLLKNGQRQMRYRLKRDYFDGVPLNQVRKTSPLATMTDVQWQKLETCKKNSHNRGLVRFHQTTGSRSYIAEVALLKQEKFKDEPPTAIDLFKACHCSSKTGATATMEDIVANVAEGNQAKSPTEAVAEVLTSPKFLENVGIEPKAAKRRSKAADDARVQDLEAQLEVERQGATLVRNELDELKQKVRESEEARAKDAEKREMASGETNSLLRHLLSLKD
ncbi:hypothetical protein U9M48_031373 [Paspalum notatum var. saurae]|uniref:DUF4218 domain-containing protein n=1 Tax=Paspalum notatum var. saurae TaxID=547442 RepID=A0AAQ3U2M7_PASNO